MADRDFKIEDLIIDEAAYDRYVQTFQRVEHMFGVRIKVHGDKHLLQQGQIFLFNHFARFETIIPPYIIHREANTYCRSVSDKHLFKVSEGFSNLLISVGAVPNNLPGLLPFLAAEILRGRKVVIFPEGGMMKDRRVMDDQGQFGVFSHKDKKFRKHHRGAAVLALVLELFKRRIKDRFKAGDEKRIRHWIDALGLPSREALWEAANKPTLIVPGNITFYPIRIDDNLISRGVDWFSKSAPPQLIEEMAIEGNLLFKKTDMDIRLSPPVRAEKKWYWWEDLMLKKYFLSVDSLDDFFNLRDKADTFTERLLVKCIGSETSRIRDAYMEGLYRGVTVNLSHLASVAIKLLMDNDRQEVGYQQLHYSLYIALKELQKDPDVHLHRSLTWPDRYRDLHKGISEELDRFIESCVKVGLIEKTVEGYRFREKLRQEHSFHEIRVENPLMVFANEVAPIHQVKKAVNKALWQSHDTGQKEFAAHLFDDELRAHARCKSQYSKKRYAEVNEKETVIQSGQPYLIVPKKRKKTGVLLVHGFLSSPAELKELGDKYAAEGFPVMGVRLAGHGTSPWDLHYRRWQDWLESVRRGYQILSAYCDDIVVVGFSAGGVLSLMLAAEKPEKLAGVASVCAPLTVHDRHLDFVPLVHNLNKLVSWIPSVEGIVQFHKRASGQPDVNYHSVPIHGLNEFRRMIRALSGHLQDINTHVTILQANHDPVVIPSSGDDIYKGLKNAEKTMHWIDSKRHGIIYNDTGDTHKILIDFVAARHKETQKTTMPAKNKRL